MAVWCGVVLGWAGRVGNWLADWWLGILVAWLHGWMFAWLDCWLAGTARERKGHTARAVTHGCSCLSMSSLLSTSAGWSFC